MGISQSNPSTIEKKYEVFLNFRGIDTRDGFTNFLYEALCAKSIETFRDEEKIAKGDKIWPTLLKAIRESKISVVIFSKEYASSKWCLRELVEIMECEKKNHETVIPVFYNVAVHDVRHHEGSFKDGFDQLEKEFEENLEKEQVDYTDVEKRKNEFHEEMRKWSQALKAACDLKGWRVEGPESKVIDEIVKDISEKLIRAYKLSCDFKGLFGFEKRFKQVVSLLSLDNTDTRIIGIWGMGGIGKTTIADAIFHQISCDEYGKCFIQNVRQRLEQCGGLVSVLQQEVLSKALNDQDIKLDGVSLSQRIKERLCRKKVFIVLDDVDDFFKLQELAGGLGQLGPGSRIIITTRRRDILKLCEVNDDYIYEVKGLSNQEAHQLFCHYAFGHNPPLEELMALSHKTIWAINGNPLGLKVAGSSLLGLNKLEWQSALSRLKKSPEILEVLQSSYNSLAPEHKDTFLDIACFFVGKHEDYVAKILDNCPYSLKVLSNRSLITISNNKTIQMHDLLQELGREIVCKEDLNNPGNRSRLWTQEDVLDTLKNVDGTNAIKGIFLNMRNMKEEHLSSQAFKKMKNLRFLKFYDFSFYESYRSIFYKDKLYSSKVCFPNDIDYLSNKLRSLDWLGCPLKALPPNFTVENLVELNMRHSNIEKLWEDNVHAPKLKWIILNACPYLIKVSDLLEAPLLEKIDIQFCESLLGLPSRNHFPSLTYLHLSNCNKLTGISDLLDAPLLEKINLYNCESLLDFPRPVHHYNNLRELNLSNCRNLQSFPNNIPFPSLVSLDLSECINLAKISDLLDAPLLKSIKIYCCKSLLDFPPPTHHFNNLCELNMRDCKNLQSFPNNIPFPSLVSLNLSGCINLVRISDLLDAPLLKRINLYCCKSLLNFPPPIHHYNNLCELNLSYCKNLQNFPNNIPFPSLVSLDLSTCSNLARISDSLDAPLIEMIDLSRCRSLLDLPPPVQHFNKLSQLNLMGCENLRSFPNNIPFPSLVYLELSGCINLTKISDFLDAPLLERIYLEDCSSLLCFPSPFQHLNNLRSLNLRGCKNLRSFPSNNIYFPSLTCLDFHECINLTKFPHIPRNIKSLHMRMTGIDEVPSSIENLSELVELDLAECRSLKHISISICKLKALRKLNLRNCSALECFPEILDTMGSLKILVLSRTTIKGLHHSIENLSGLEMLFLRECKNLEMLPISIYNLTSLNILCLSGCSKLESLLGNSVANLSNCGESATTKRPICRLSKCTLCFINCLNLNKTIVINIMELRINHHRDMAIKGCGTQVVDLKFYYPGSEVPGWFKYQTDGSLINIQMSRHDGVNGHLIGLAACAVIKFYGRGYDSESVTVNISYCHRCHCMGSRRWISSIKVSYEDETFIDYVALWYSDASILKLCENGCQNYSFEFFLFYTSPIGRVKYCGIYPIYEKHNITLPSIANETCVAVDQDFGETSVKEQGKIRKFSDEAETCGRSDEDVIEPHPKRTCSLPNPNSL